MHVVPVPDFLCVASFIFVHVSDCQKTGDWFNDAYFYVTIYDLCVLAVFVTFDVVP